jgi:hypothetical protein
LARSVIRPRHSDIFVKPSANGFPANNEDPSRYSGRGRRALPMLACSTILKTTEVLSLGLEPTPPGTELYALSNQAPPQKPVPDWNILCVGIPRTEHHVIIGGEPRTPRIRVFILCVRYRIHHGISAHTRWACAISQALSGRERSPCLRVSSPQSDASSKSAVP